MSVLGATLLVLAGLAIMGFGIFLFYAWLPFLYGLFGVEIGLLLGRWLTGGIGLVAIIFGIVSAVILFCAVYIIEPYRRMGRHPMKVPDSANSRAFAWICRSLLPHARLDVRLRRHMERTLQTLGKIAKF